jgi:hypothetical protein
MIALRLDMVAVGRHRLVVKYTVTVVIGDGLEMGRLVADFYSPPTTRMKSQSWIFEYQIA